MKTIHCQQYWCVELVNRCIRWICTLLWACCMSCFMRSNHFSLVWTGLCFVSQLILPEIYVVFGWIRQAYLTDHRLRASSMSTGYFNMQACLVRQIHLNTLLTWLISKIRINLCHAFWNTPLIVEQDSYMMHSILNCSCFSSILGKKDEEHWCWSYCLLINLSFLANFWLFCQISQR